MPHEALARTPPAAELQTYREEAVRFGDGGRLMGILTLPEGARASAAPLPVFVFFNAGLLHRVGPRRLHVDLARRLARLGFPSLRLDQSGIGDSAMQVGVPAAEQATRDFRDVAAVIRSHLGQRPLVLGGLCAGADSAIFMANRAGVEVAGLFLLDPVSYPDRWFKVRSLARIGGEVVTHPVFHARLFLHRVGLYLSGERRVDQLALREVPSREETRRAFEMVRASGGQVFSLFTRYSLIYYNRQGQLRKALGIPGYDAFCTELFWPTTNHVLPIAAQRNRLINAIDAWARGFLPRT